MFESIIEVYIPLIAYALMRSTVLFALALGSVYITGRMLELVMSNRMRNLVALLVMAPASYVSVLMYDMDILVHPWEVWWRSIVYVCISSVLFVTVGWHFYDRVDNLLDKKFAPDETPKEEPKPKAKRRVRTKPTPKE